MEHKFSKYDSLDEIKDCLEDTLGEAEMWTDQAVCDIVNSGVKSIDPAIIEAILGTAAKDSDWVNAKAKAKALYSEKEGLEKVVKEVERQHRIWVLGATQYWWEEYTKLNK